MLRTRDILLAKEQTIAIVPISFDIEFMQLLTSLLDITWIISINCYILYGTRDVLIFINRSVHNASSNVLSLQAVRI